MSSHVDSDAENDMERGEHIFHAMISNLNLSIDNNINLVTPDDTRMCSPMLSNGNALYIKCLKCHLII